MKQLQNIRIGILGLLVSTLAVYFITKEINLSLVSEAFANARYIYLIPCIVFLLLGLFVRAYRWQTLLNFSLPYWRSFSIMNVAYLVNGVLPLRIGEVARVYLASRANPPVPPMQSTGTIIVERLLDLWAVVILTAFALTQAPVPAELQTIGLLMGIASLLGLFILAILARRRDLLHRWLGWLLNHAVVLQKFDLKTWLDHFLNGLQPLTNWRSFLQVTVLTVISWTFSVIAGYILMFAFYEQGGWAVTALYIASAAFAIALPAVPGNIGTYEASILVALVAMGYEQSETATAFAVMVHAINVFVHAGTGIIGFIHEGISLEQLSHGVQQIQHPTQPST